MSIIITQTQTQKIQVVQSTLSARVIRLVIDAKDLTNDIYNTMINNSDPDLNITDMSTQMKTTAADLLVAWATLQALVNTFQPNINAAQLPNNVVVTPGVGVTVTEAQSAQQNLAQAQVSSRT